MTIALQYCNITVNDPVWLAPMTGVSDLPFRKLVKSFGAGMVAYMDKKFGPFKD